MTPVREPPPDVAVELVGVGKAFDHRPVLRGIDLRVLAGETVAVLGANGSGKSTLLRVLATLLAPSRGTISWFGRPTDSLPAVRRRLGFVPHESLLYGGLTVEENLRFFAGLYGLVAARADAALEELELHGLRSRRARILSRGQRQQADLARALLHNPDVLILDEPFTGLDLEAVLRLQSLLESQRARGRTLIFTTHDPNEARALADRATVLLGGRLTAAVPPGELDDAQLAAWFRQGRR